MRALHGQAVVVLPQVQVQCLEGPIGNLAARPQQEVRAAGDAVADRGGRERAVARRGLGRIVEVQRVVVVRALPVDRQRVLDVVERPARVLGQAADLRVVPHVHGVVARPRVHDRRREHFADRQLVIPAARVDLDLVHAAVGDPGLGHVPVAAHRDVAERGRARIVDRLIRGRDHDPIPRAAARDHQPVVGAAAVADVNPAGVAHAD